MKLVEFSKRFPNEEACEQYLKEQREKAGVVCKKCGCHKQRSVMGLRDGKYKLSDTIELDEAFFTTESSKEEAKSETLKRGSGSQRKTKMLVMIESEAVPENEQKKGKKDRKSGHLKMKVILNRRTFGDRRFDRLVVAAVTYKPTFQHRLYNSKRSSNCG